jgi:predicted GH43/DUF377 family glycosyl hydrolase
MKLTKYKGNPILSPNPENDWESLCVLNPAVVLDDDNTFKMLYRAAGNDEEHYIYLGLATSKDGFTFTREFDHPVLEPDKNGADGGGVEDPRAIKLGDHYYITYASRPYFPGQYWLGDDKKKKPVHASVEPLFLMENKTCTHLAITKDFIHFKKLGRITDSRYDNRDVILFSEKVNGKYVLLSRPMEWVGPEYGTPVPSIWISYSDDLMEWDTHTLLAKPEQWWEDKKIGASTPPLRTEDGWLLLYHGVSEKDSMYRVGAMLLQLDNPSNIIARTTDFIMEPEFDFETNGYYNGCVFPTGNVIKDNILYVYYGAADRYICVATCEVDELLSYLKSQALQVK